MWFLLHSGKQEYHQITSNFSKDIRAPLSTYYLKLQKNSNTPSIHSACQPGENGDNFLFRRVIHRMVNSQNSNTLLTSYWINPMATPSSLTTTCSSLSQWMPQKDGGLNSIYTFIAQKLILWFFSVPFSHTNLWGSERREGNRALCNCIQALDNSPTTVWKPAVLCSIFSRI